jgi:glutamyl-tRNA reductase
MVPLIRQLRDSAEEARLREVERAAKMLARGDDPKTVLEALSHGLTNKLMHAPTEALNQSGEGDKSLKALVARLYRLRARD